jgi:hypothetical protein
MNLKQICQVDPNISHQRFMLISAVEVLYNARLHTTNPSIKLIGNTNPHPLSNFFLYFLCR